MKFGLHLRQGLVPEWRDQYLNYNQGKKKLEKLGDRNPVSQRVDSPPVGPGNNNSRPDQSVGDLQLPPPALPGRDITDQSPLLESSTSRKYGEEESKSPSKARNNSTSWIARKIRSSFPVRYSADLVPLDTMMEMAEQEFIAWVDSEVEKLNGFFRDREKEAVERYLLLQDQLIRLAEQRESVRRENVANSGIQKAAAGTKFMLIKEFELPSMPLVFKSHSKWEGRYDNEAATTDFTRRDYTTPYPVAKRQLKVALSEYYRSLELLKGYRALNTTAIRKIMKKFDKTTGRTCTAGYLDKVKKTHLVQSDILDNLLARTEDLYAYYLEDGNHKHAVEKLRAQESPEDHYAAMFTTGAFIGLGLPFAIDAIVVGLQSPNSDKAQEIEYLFQIWGGIFLINLLLCLFTINLLVLTAYRINYPFIFEFDQRNYLDYKQYGVLPSCSLFLMSVFAWFTFHDFWPVSFPGRYFPPIYLGISLVLFLWPFKMFYWRARKWLLIALVRLFMSGLYPVEFRDFFVGDMFCSLNYSLSNASFFFCLYAKRWGYFGSTYDPVVASQCASLHSWSLGFLETLPGIWRFMQCFRRFADTGDIFPHLANAAKYSCLILYYMFLSLTRIHHESTAFHVLFVTSACLNAIYSSFWDLFMDFSLMQPDAKNKWLRNELAFKSPIPYYLIIVVDPILRFNWIFYAIYWSQMQQTTKVSFFVSMVEVLRRFLWVFFRVENEHAANVSIYRASRDLALPYAEVERRETPTSRGRPTPADSRHSSRRSSPGLDDRSRVEPAVLTQQPPEQALERLLPPDEEAQRRRPSRVSPSRTPQDALAPYKSSTTSSPLTPAQKFAAYATPVLRAVSTAVKSAHTADFQRRLPKAEDEGDSGSDQE